MPQHIQTHRLANGLTLVAENMSHLRSAAWSLLIPAGAATDPAGHSGAAQLLSGMVYRGAGDRDARALSNALDDLGVQRGGRVESEYLALGGALLADDLAAALAIYADIVRRPHLPAAELDAERALAIQAIQGLNDNPTQRLFRELNRVYFPGPFGRSPLGEIDEITAITPADIQADHAARFRPAGAVLAVAGRVDFAALQATVEELFGDWDGAAPAAPAAVVRAEPLYQHLPQDTAQTQIGVAYTGVPLGDPNYYLARLALNVLSGGMGARLFTEVREKRGLVYSVAAFPRIFRGLGLVLGYAGTQPERAQETVDVLLGELRGIGRGVSAEELERARTGLLAALVMSGEATSSRAGAMASDVFLLGRPRTLDEIREAVEQVTLAELNDYLADHAPATFTVLTLGPAPVEIR